MVNSAKPKIKDGIQRISVLLKKSVYRALDELVEKRDFVSRSQAISEMIH